MKTLTKFLFLSLFLSLFIVSFSSLSPFAVGSEIQDPVINTDVLSVSLGSFQDSTTGDGSGKLKTASGGYDLLSFENMGIASVDEETNTILYRARATFGFEVNVWTECTYRDIFPYIDINHQTEHEFFKLVYKNHNSLGTPFTSSVQHYYSKFREIDYGTTTTLNIGLTTPVPTTDLKSGSYLTHNYDGYLPVVVSVDSGLKFSGEIMLQGETFTIPKLTADIINTKYVSSRDGECGQYEDRYTDTTGINEGTVKIEILDDTLTKLTSGSEKIADWVNDQNLGWSLFKDVSSDPFASIQQGIRSKGCIGTVYSDNTPLTYDTMTFALLVNIQPEVTKQAQILEFTVAYIQYWKDSGTLKPYYGAVTETYQRDVSVHVYNQFVHYEFEVPVDLFMTCQFTGELSQSFLSDPDLHLSDMIWSNDLLGAHKLNIGVKKDPQWWDWIIWLIVIVVIGYIVYKFYSKYKESKKNRPYKR